MSPFSIRRARVGATLSGPGRPSLAAISPKRLGPLRDVRYVWRRLPLSDVHPNTQFADRAAEAAAEQGAFWLMHDLLLDHQDALRPGDLIAYAEQLHLDVERFANDLREHTGAARVADDIDAPT